MTQLIYQFNINTTHDLQNIPLIFMLLHSGKRTSGKCVAACCDPPFEDTFYFCLDHVEKQGPCYQYIVILSFYKTSRHGLAHLYQIFMNGVFRYRNLDDIQTCKRLFKLVHKLWQMIILTIFLLVWCLLF